MIAPATSMGAVHLTIADLNRSLDFYESRIGLATHQRTSVSASLGVGGRTLVVLVESTTARYAQGTTGLYHFALVVPSRLDLARSLRRFIDTQTTMQGFADHRVSEALYLADPDGNGIEVYRDRPRDEWPISNGALQMSVDPLDVAGVLGELERAGDDGTWTGLVPGTRMGHMHLQVSHINDAKRFYVDVLEFDVTLRYGAGALFVSAGGYHHHLGLNTWIGVGAPPPPHDAIGLRHFEITLPDRASLDAVVTRIGAAGVPMETHADGVLVRDPSQNAIVLRLGERPRE